MNVPVRASCPLLIAALTAAAPAQAADLTISSISAPPTQVAEGQTITLSYVVQNRGPDIVFASSIALYLSDRPNSGSTGIELTEEPLSTIDAGDFATGSLLWTVPVGTPQNQTFFLAVAVDNNNVVREIDENNNSADAGPFSVGGAAGGAIMITTRTLTPGRVGDVYSATLRQSGASNPTWSIVTGSLPPGVTLDAASGRLEGTPLSQGTFPFRAQAEQAGHTPGSADLLLTVTEAGGLRVDTVMLPEAAVGQPFSGSITASGGSPPYAFQAVNGAPSWFQMVSDGTITGTPDAPGSFEIEVSCFDSMQNFTSGIVMLEVIQAGPLMIETTPDQIPAGQTGVAYSFMFSATGGRRPYAWSVSEGTLPGGLNLTTEGLLSGSPSEMGNAQLTVAVRDGEGATQTINILIRVTEMIPLAIRIPTTIRVRFGEEASFALNAEGGVPPYSWTHDGGLPAGLSISEGQIVGIATSSTASDVEITVSDALGARDSAMVTVQAVDGSVGTGNGGSSSGGSPGGGRGRGRGRSGGCSATHDLDHGSSSLVASMLALGLLLGWRRRRSVLNTRA